MLVCPQCQFENPDSHNFCQRCGMSLVEKDCPDCGAVVPLDVEFCPQCGATTGTLWRAILSPVRVGSRPITQLQVETPLAAPPPPAAIRLPSGKYLDVQQRYQLLEPLPATLPVATELEVRVLDLQPLRPAEVASRAQLLSNGATPAALPFIPDIAYTYGQLQERFPALPWPHLHEAWQHDGFSVVLISDRSNLPLLLDCWTTPEAMPLQILHWMHEMVELWAALQPYHCCRSLLEQSNLRVDEDQVLCLQRLYPDSLEHPSCLSDLGRLWSALERLSQRTDHPELTATLTKLCQDLDRGAMVTIAALRSRVESIAASFSDHLTPMPMTSSSFQPQEPVLTPPIEPTDPALPVVEPVASSGSADDDITDITAAHGPELADGEDDEEGNGESDDSPTVVLSMRLVSLEDAGTTDKGRQRDHNEDCFSIQTEVKKLETPQGRQLHAKGLYILCDGMGGHAGGEVASRLAVETLQHYFENHWTDQLPSEDSIRDAVRQANRVLYDRNQQNASSGSGRMGTTLVLMLLHDTEAVIAHVGDSRLYRLSRRRGLEQITVDHEVGQREIQRGVEPALAYARPDAYQLTQALGPRDENFIHPEVKYLELNEDMVLLLCSDGLSDNDLLETHWQSHLEPLLSAQFNLEQGVQQLIELANQHNGHDNITAIAIRSRVRPNLDQLNHR